MKHAFAYLSTSALEHAGTSPKAPDWVMLIPAGRIETNDGRWFENSDADTVVRTFKDGGLHLPFDFEHSSETKRKEGDFTPAAGWIVDLANRAGAIWARVEWNDRGRKAIEAKEVKYVSPAFSHHPESMKVLKLSSAALTLMPAISELPALASKQDRGKIAVDRVALCGALGIPDISTAIDVLSAVERLSTKRSNLSATEFVPRTQYDALLARCTKAETAMGAKIEDTLKQDAEAFINEGTRAGKIPPAAKSMYMRLCATREGLEETKALLATMPPMVSTRVAPEREEHSSGTLTSETRSIAKQFGLSESDMKGRDEYGNRQGENL